MNRLALHGEDYKLPEVMKKAALKNILTGKIKDNFELWDTEKMSFEELLRRMRDQVRLRNWSATSRKGRAGINLGANQANAQQ